MTQTPNTEQRIAALERKYEEIDDVVVERCLAIMDVAGELHTQAMQRLDRAEERMDRFDERFNQFLVRAEADHQIMLEILRYLRNQHPGNGSSPS